MEGRLGDPKGDEESPKTRDGNGGTPIRGLEGPEWPERDTKGARERQFEEWKTHDHHRFIIVQASPPDSPL